MAYQRNKWTHSAWRAANRRKRKAAGICSDCSAPVFHQMRENVEHVYVRCMRCLRRMAAWQFEGRERKQAKRVKN